MFLFFLKHLSYTPLFPHFTPSTDTQKGVVIANHSPACYVLFYIAKCYNFSASAALLQSPTNIASAKQFIHKRPRIRIITDSAVKASNLMIQKSSWNIFLCFYFSLYLPPLRPSRNHSNSKMLDGSFFLFLWDSHSLRGSPTARFYSPYSSLRKSSLL